MISVLNNPTPWRSLCTLGDFVLANLIYSYPHRLPWWAVSKTDVKFVTSTSNICYLSPPGSEEARKAISQVSVRFEAVRTYPCLALHHLHTHFPRLRMPIMFVIFITNCSVVCYFCPRICKMCFQVLYLRSLPSWLSQSTSGASLPTLKNWDKWDGLFCFAMGANKVGGGGRVWGLSKKARICPVTSEMVSLRSVRSKGIVWRWNIAD